MNMYLSRFKAIQFSAIIIVLLYVVSCTPDNKKETQSDDLITVDSLELNEQIIKDVKAVKAVFYSLPSPLETAMILKQAGAIYNPELLNDIDNAEKYVTNKQMALNLGVYTTDLSYASLFDQTQTTINYMNASKKMADGLGILNAIDESIVERLEANVNNRDVIMDIISETILNSSSFFEENDRQSLSSLVLVGGWIEGLYIATNLIEDDANLKNNELVNRVIDQKLTLETVIRLLEANRNNSDVKEVLTNITEIKKVYDKIKITTSKIEPVTDKETNVTTLKSKTEVTMSPETYKQLKDEIRVIRTNYTL
ncbi:MAG: hypothetical protein PF487_04700 [Bacteroidales bacterium]|jgi:hypothetical protein|nr:hypothetical protein [Bacteroidales bacterium]